MILTPDGPYEVTDRDGLARCFDATAASVYRWICRLVGGEGATAVGLLAEVFIRLDETRAQLGRITIDAALLEATSFRVAVDAEAAGSAGSASGAIEVVDRAVLDLAVGQHRTADEIAAVLGIATTEAATRITAIRARFAPEDRDATEILGRADGWLDDASRGRARQALLGGTSSDQPRRMDTPERPAGAAQVPSHPNRSRRTMAIAGVAVVAVLAGGFWWSDSSRSDRSSAPDGTPLDLGSDDSSTPATDRSDPPTTVRTTVPSTTTETSTTTNPYGGPGLRLSPGFIATDLPAGVQPTGLYESMASDNEQDPRTFDTWYQFWAEPDATRTSGRWFWMSTRAWTDGYDYPRQDSTRIAGEGLAGLQTTTPDGLLQLDLRIRRDAGDIGVTILSNGIVEADLERMARSLVHFDPPLGSGTLDEILATAAYEPSSMAADVVHGMEVLASGPAACCGVLVPNDPTEFDTRDVTYASLDDPRHGAWFSIRTSDGIASVPLRRFTEMRSPDPDAPTNPSSTMLIGDRVVHVSGASWTDGDTTRVSNSGWWVEDGRTVTVSGTITVAQLSAIIASSRLATTDAWLQLNEQASLAPQPTYIDPTAGPIVALGEVALDDGSSWSFDSSTSGTGGNLQYDIGSNGLQSGTGGAWSVDTSDTVREFETIDATAIVVSVVDVTDPAVQIRITVGGRDPVLRPLVRIGTTNVSMAFDAFTQLPPYTVELVDAAGNVLRGLSN